MSDDEELPPLTFEEAMKEVVRLNKVDDDGKAASKNSRERAAVLLYEQRESLGVTKFWKRYDAFHDANPKTTRSKGDVEKLLADASKPDLAEAMKAAREKNRVHQAKHRAKLAKEKKEREERERKEQEERERKEREEQERADDPAYVSGSPETEPEPPPPPEPPTVDELVDLVNALPDKKRAEFFKLFDPIDMGLFYLRVMNKEQRATFEEQSKTVKPKAKRSPKVQENNGADQHAA